MTTPANSRPIALVVAAASFMQMLDGVIIATALPQMARSFGVAPVAMSIGVTAYLLTSAVFIPMAGWLADRFGDKRVFLAAIAIFTLASLACGLAQDLPQFIAFRAIQGIGGAFMTPVGRMIVLRNAPKSELVNAIALITWPALIAPVIGPVLGGFITSYLDWRWNFFINVPLGGLGLLLVARLVPASPGTAVRPMDWLGFVLTAAGLSAMLVGFEVIVHDPGLVWMALGLLAFGLVLGTLAIAHLRRAAHPLFDLSSFRHQTFAVSNLFAGTYFRLAINATPFLLPLLFQVGFNFDPALSGSLIMAYFLGNLGMKTVTTPLLRALGFRNLLVINGMLSALSIGLLALLQPSMPFAVMGGVLVFAGLTRSMQFTALATLAFADVEAAERSSASTISSMLQQISMLLAVALAALSLRLLAGWSGRAEPAIADFGGTFLLFALMAVLASLLSLRIRPDAGRDVSGHRATAR